MVLSTPFIYLIGAIAAGLLLWFIVHYLRRYFWRPERLSYESLFPSQFITVDGIKTHFVQNGSGPDMVLIHGIGSSLHFWKPILPRLTAHFRVTALDLPGFGLSEKHIDRNYGLDDQTERVFHFLNELKIDKFHLVGHSMGGAIATWMARTQPQRILSLSLIAPALYPRRIWIPPTVLAMGATMLKKFIVTPALVRWIYTNVCVESPPADIENIIQQYYLPFDHSPNTVVTFVKHNELLRDSRLGREIPLANIPIVLLHGDKDKIIKENYLRPFLKQNPHAKYITSPRAGHMLTEENPAFVIENLEKFLTSK